MQYISKDNLVKLLDVIQKEYDTFIPIKKGKNRLYKRYSQTMKLRERKNNTEENEIVLGEVRTIEPLKAFFSRARECVAEGFKDEVPHSSSRPYCMVGVKACDLKGFKIQDNVFKEEDFFDPIYINHRENNLIISADCTCAIDTCFCLSLDLKPYPQEEFDLNLSEVSQGFIVEVGSNKGQTIIDGNSSLFEEAKDDLVSEKEDQRLKVIKEVKENIKQYGIPYQDRFEGIIKKNYDSTIWGEEAKTCVECGACNTICPTCHCFLLYDQMSVESMERLRVWDSCMIKDFARVAAGVNPRPWLWMRLRNRYEKKFDFFPKRASLYACTGCGRCITACPAKIDIRKILKRLVKDAKN